MVVDIACMGAISTAQHIPLLHVLNNEKNVERIIQVNCVLNNEQDTCDDVNLHLPRWTNGQHYTPSKCAVALQEEANTSRSSA